MTSSSCRLELDFTAVFDDFMVRGFEVVAEDMEPYILRRAHEVIPRAVRLDPSTRFSVPGMAFLEVRVPNRQPAATHDKQEPAKEVQTPPPHLQRRSCSPSQTTRRVMALHFPQSSRQFCSLRLQACQAFPRFRWGGQRPGFTGVPVKVARINLFG